MARKQTNRTKSHEICTSQIAGAIAAATYACFLFDWTKVRLHIGSLTNIHPLLASILCSLHVSMFNVAAFYRCSRLQWRKPRKLHLLSQWQESSSISHPLDEGASGVDSVDGVKCCFIPFELV